MGVPFEKILQQPTPRYLDVYSQLAILFSGMIQQMGWIFYGFGMIFVIVFLPFSNWKYLMTSGPWETVDGVVIEATGTSSYVNDTQVWEYGFQFSLQGDEYTGHSYADGEQYSLQQTVPVRVNTRKPHISKIEGTRYGAFPRFIAFVLLFPLVGLGMIIPGLRRQAKSLDLLRNGSFTRGKLRKKETTGTTITINNQSFPVYRFLFDFEHGGASFQAVAKTHITGPVEDEAEEAILFYPTDPSFNVVYDGISNSPGMDSMGNFIPVSWKKILLFIGPLFSILITTLAFLVFSAI